MTAALKEGIFTVLSADPGLSGLVGDNIYPDRADQKQSFPYITYQIASEQGVHHLVGVDTLALIEIQFNVWAGTPDSRSAVQDALRVLLDGTIRTSFGAAFVARVWNTNNVDTTEGPDEGSQNFAYGVFMDFNFWYRR